MLKLNSKLFIYVKILFFATVFSIFTQCPGLAENFTIEKYIVELNVQADGSIDVKEAIAIAQTYFKNQETYILLENDLPDVFNEK